MKVDALFDVELARWAQAASHAELAGFDAAISPELAHDPFLPLALAAPQTENIDLMTGIAVAFARNPMTLAVSAADIHRLSGGRMILGLGSQIRAHITRRFSMPWSQPAARMREFIQAMRAIWTSWNDASPLAFDGDFYSHTLMTHMFSPGPSQVGNPQVFLAAVGPAMTKVAGEVADGLLVHAFTTDSYLREVTLPQLHQGLDEAGRTRSDVEVSISPMAVVATPESREQQDSMLRMQIAFYGSTPAYRPVLEHHGWGELAEELHRLSKTGAWNDMGRLIEDDIFGTFAFLADTPDELGRMLIRRFGDVVDRIQIGFDPLRPEIAGSVIESVRAATAASAVIQRG